MRLYVRFPIPPSRIETLTASAGPPCKRSLVYRVLFDEDILYMIAREIYERVDGRGAGRVALARLARTARGFNLVATRVLWERMDSVAPLLKTIPGLSWVPIKRKFWVQWGVQPRPSDEWAYNLEAFKRYSACIKELKWIEGGITKKTLSFFVKVLARELGGPWLPTLRKFEDYSTSQPAPLSVFCTHTLAIVHVSPTPRKEPWVAETLDYVSTRCLALKELCLWDPTDLTLDASPPTPTEALQYALTLKKSLASLVRHGLTNLRVLHVRIDTFSDDLATLAILPHLTELNMCMRLTAAPPKPHDWYGSALPACSFPSLRRLQMDFGHNTVAPWHSTLIESIASTELTDLRLYFRISTLPGGRHEQERELLCVIAQSAFHRALKCLHFNVGHYLHGTDADPFAPFTMHTLSPILQLPNLAELYVEVPSADLTEGDLSAMATAWPRLRDIQVHQTAFRSARLLDMEWIQAFALQCRGLHTIGFTVRAADNISPRASVLLDQVVPVTSVRDNQCRVGIDLDCRLVRLFGWAYMAALFPYARQNRFVFRIFFLPPRSPQ